MSQARLIVCETTSKWAVALRRVAGALRRVAGAEMQSRLCETRSLEDCWGEAVVSPYSVVLVELTSANLERVAHELIRYRSELRHVRAVVAGDRDMLPAQNLILELGAVRVLFSLRRVAVVIEIAQRHWNTHAGVLAKQQEWLRLPWGGSGSELFAPERELPGWVGEQP
jgi:hypothetical protein